MAAKKTIDSYFPVEIELAVVHVKVPAELKTRTEKNMARRPKKLKWNETVAALLERFNDEEEARK